MFKSLVQACHDFKILMHNLKGEQKKIFQVSVYSV